MDLDQIKYLQTIKSNKTNVDVMHQGLCYRVGSAQELDQELDRKTFLKKLNIYGVGFTRVKIRKNFRFEFMEFSFTKTFEIKNQSKINEILYLAKIDTPDNLEVLKSQALCFVENNKDTDCTHEIELEIVDMDHFRDFLKRKDLYGFNSVVFRMLRNAEALYDFPDSFHLGDYKQTIGKGIDPNLVQTPLIGEYLNSLYAGGRKD